MVDGGPTTVEAQAAKDDQTAPARQPQVDNWGTWLVDNLLYPAAIFATPLFLACLIVYLILSSFLDSTAEGIRSFAAALLPLMVLTYLIQRQRDALASTTEKTPNVLAFAISLVLGFIVFWTLTLATSAPVAEIAMSGAFAFLVFSYISLAKERMISYFFGAILGFLLYIVTFGFPELS